MLADAVKLYSVWRIRIEDPGISQGKVVGNVLEVEDTSDILLNLCAHNLLYVRSLGFKFTKKLRRIEKRLFSPKSLPPSKVADTAYPLCEYQREVS